MLLQVISLERAVEILSTLIPESVVKHDLGSVMVTEGWSRVHRHVVVSVTADEKAWVVSA